MDKIFIVFLTGDNGCKYEDYQEGEHLVGVFTTKEEAKKFLLIACKGSEELGLYEIQYNIGGRIAEAFVNAYENYFIEYYNFDGENISLSKDSIEYYARIDKGHDEEPIDIVPQAHYDENWSEEQKKWYDEVYYQ